MELNSSHNSAVVNFVFSIQTKSSFRSASGAFLIF
jgi:hypothetical protein